MVFHRSLTRSARTTFSHRELICLLQTCPPPMQLDEHMLPTSRSAPLTAGFTLWRGCAPPWQTTPARRAKSRNASLITTLPPNTKPPHQPPQKIATPHRRPLRRFPHPRHNLLLSPNGRVEQMYPLPTGTAN